VLTAEQIKAREGKLTASRVACLMTGDKEALLRLYREMIGEAQPEDLSKVWPVRLGETTEKLQLDWYEQKNAHAVIQRGCVMVHPVMTWAAATLDGWIFDLNCPIEAKHVGGREPFEVIIDRYQPQKQWTMFVTGAPQCALSVIMGASEPIVEFIPRDDAYIEEMVKRGEMFMRHVADKTPPVALDPVAPPADAKKTYDMTGQNAWASSSFVWIETKPAADRCRDAEKILKSLVPADAKKCFGHGTQITRDRAGRLSLREQT
jgi:predicted phage-related endonuclease